jgi:hypothetical protein
VEILKYLLGKDIEVHFCNLIQGGVEVELIALFSGNRNAKMPESKSFIGKDIEDGLRQAYDFVKSIS